MRIQTNDFFHFITFINPLSTFNSNSFVSKFSKKFHLLHVHSYLKASFWRKENFFQILFFIILLLDQSTNKTKCNNYNEFNGYRYKERIKQKGKAITKRWSKKGIEKLNVANWEFTGKVSEV